MKTILRIIIILLVASVVAGAFVLVVNNGTTSSSSEGRQPAAMTSADGQSLPLMEPPEGGEHDGGSAARGISGVLITLAKFAAITLVVLPLQKGLEKWNLRNWNWAQG